MAMVTRSVLQRLAWAAVMIGTVLTSTVPSSPGDRPVSETGGLPTPDTSAETIRFFEQEAVTAIAHADERLSVVTDFGPIHQTATFSRAYLEGDSSAPVGPVEEWVASMLTADGRVMGFMRVREGFANPVEDVAVGEALDTVPQTAWIVEHPTGTFAVDGTTVAAVDDRARQLLPDPVPVSDFQPVLPGGADVPWYATSPGALALVGGGAVLAVLIAILALRRSRLRAAH